MTANRLLASLPVEELAKLKPHLDDVPLKAKQVLHFKGMPIEHVYFIEDGLVSVLADTGGGDAVEAWLIGRDGMVGLPVLLGGTTSPFRRVVNVGGRALRIPAERIRHAMDERPILRHLFSRYAQAVLIQSGQVGACANRHSFDERLARWLLSAQYRLGRGELPLTHALLARLIGARRASVTVALGALEAEGIVRQRRGTIIVADRERLEGVACDCHRVIKMAYDAIESRPRMPIPVDSGPAPPLEIPAE